MEHPNRFGLTVLRVRVRPSLSLRRVPVIFTVRARFRSTPSYSQTSLPAWHFEPGALTDKVQILLPLNKLGVGLR